MAVNKAYQAYKKMDVQTASQAKLIIMMYDSAIRHVKTAIEGLAQTPRPIQQIHNSLVTAQDIVTELQVSLNHDAGEVAANLSRIYNYVNRLLMTGNIKKSAPPLNEARTCLETLRGAWQDIFEKHPGSDRPVPQNDATATAGPAPASSHHNGLRLSINW